MILTIWNRSSFRLGDYRWYWMGNVLIHITYLLQAVALAWHMLEITDSPFQVGLVAFAYGLPLLVVSPFSGLLADRFKRQWLVQGALAVAVLTSATLALTVKGGNTNPLQILIGAFMLGTAFSLYAPARMALLPNLVPETMVFNATTLSYSGTRLMGFFGPVMAGYLLQSPISSPPYVYRLCYLPSARASISRRHIFCRVREKRKRNMSVSCVAFAK